MPTINNSTKKAYNSLFDKTVFNIPKYQRAYSWEENNWRELWDDIKNIVLEKDKEHFLGAIIYYHGSSNNHKYSHYDVIDGQQRLTTLTILMRVIYEKLRENNEEIYIRFSDEIYKKYICNKIDETFFLNLSKKDDKFFKDYVQHVNPTRNKQGKLVSNKNIRKCFDFFNERLIEYFRNNTHEKSEEICWKLKEKIEQNLVFVVVDVNTDVDAYTIFESINAKRQGLTTSDLLKNFIFSAADQIEKDKPDSKKLSKTEDLWDRMEQDLEKTEINQYIRHYWVSNYEKVFEKELYQQIKIRFQSNYPEILSFFEKVVSESEIYSSIIAGEVSALTKGANKALEQLRQLRNRQYYPLVLSALTSEKISDEVSQLIIDISSVAVRRSIIGKNPNELESFFSENASKLRRKEITIFDLRQTLFKDFWINDEQILLELRSMDFSDQEYLAKFILKEYEIDKGVEEKKLGKVSLEHVLPRNPENLDDWGITEDKKNEIVWNLGNLALIGQTYNSKMSNKSFKKKLPFLKKSEIKTTASIATLENWDEGSILERNNKLGDFIVKCWKKS
jgi:uncharacterized protein with ParB-like and HNH nuclease domain